MEFNKMLNVHVVHVNDYMCRIQNDVCTTDNNNSMKIAI